MRKLILLLSMLCLGSAVWAQRFVSFKQYITMNVGIGLNGYSYKLNEPGTKDINGGVMARLGYHFVKRNCGVFGGMMLQSYNSNTTINMMQDIPGAVDIEGGSYTHRTRFISMEENMRQLTMSVPIEFVYRVYLFGGMRLMAGIGPMFQFTCKNSYRVTSGTNYTSLYYPEADLEFPEPRKDGGYPQDLDQLSHYHAQRLPYFNGSYTLKSVPGGVCDISVIYSMEKSFDLNIGFYGTYSFVSQTKSHDQPLYDPDCMSADGYRNTHYNGIFDSQVTKDMKPFTFGVMVGLYYYIKTGN